MANRYPRHFCALGVIGYRIPQAFFDRLLDRVRNQGKFQFIARIGIS